MDDGPLLNEEAENPPVLVQIVSPGSFPEPLALGSPNYSLMDSSMSFQTSGDMAKGKGSFRKPVDQIASTFSGTQRNRSGVIEAFRKLSCHGLPSVIMGGGVASLASAISSTSSCPEKRRKARQHIFSECSYISDSRIQNYNKGFWFIKNEEEARNICNLIDVGSLLFR